MAAPVHALFTALNTAGIAWCSWKSNQHLNAAVEAKTDLDLLFAKNSRDAAEVIFKNCGYKIFNTAWFRTFPGMLDAFSLDRASGNLIHAHCHFGLVLGEKYLKSFDVPWADEILEHRAEWENDKSAYVSDPADELVLLLLRESLKMRFGDTGPKPNPEFDWLKKRVSSRTLQERAMSLLSADCAAIMAELYDLGLQPESLRELQARAKHLLVQNGWRRMNTARAVPEQWARQFLSLKTQALARYNVLWPYLRRRRSIPGHGLIIAVLGADGSGKSTVVRTVTSGWRGKIDISRIYFGRAKLPKFLKSKKPSKPKTENKTPSSWPFIARALFDAARKRTMMNRARTLRAKGAIVLCDRYPQKQFSGFNDGPLLTHLLEDKNKFRRRAAEWELKQFEKFEKTAPDIVIRLMPSLDTALARKPGEADAETIKTKMEALKTTKFANAKDHTINADKPLPEVLSEIRALIWGTIP